MVSQLPELLIAYPYDGEPLLRNAYEYVDFRAAFTARAGDTLTLYMSAHDRYKLWCNGQLCGVGPLKSNGVYTYADTYDLSSALVDGENEVVVRVLSYHAWPDGAGFPSCLSMHAFGDAPCLFVSGVLSGAAGETVLSTGHYPWTAARFTAITQTYYHEAHFLGGFEDYNADPALCGQAVPARVVADISANPYGELYKFQIAPRPVPIMSLDAQAVNTLTLDGAAVALAGHTVPPHTKRSLLYDAGRESTAFVRLFADGDGATVTMTFAECYIKRDGNRVYKEKRDDATGFLEGYSDVWRTHGGTGSYEPYHFRTFRYIRIDVETGDAPLTLRGMTLTHAHYPLEIKTAVHAEEEWLNRFWEISLHTLRCCMHETYEDCPYYEQLQYMFDARLEILFTYALSGDTRLAAQALYDYHESQLPDGMIFSRNPCDKRQIIPSFSLHYVLTVADYVRETGNTDVLELYLPTVDGILGFYRRHTDARGCVSHMPLPYWDFLDWIREWGPTRGASPYAEQDISVTHSLLYACALQTAADLHVMCGHGDTAAQYRERAARINEAVNAAYYDEARGMYREANVESPDVWLQHAQMFAVLSGAAEGARAEQVMRAAMADTTACGEPILRCTYPMQFYLCRALEQTGLYRLTAGLFATWKAQLDLNISTIPETPTDPRSECHGWGALLLYEAPRVILGVRYDCAEGTLTLQPAPCGITMQGDVYTPYGQVQAAVSDKDGRFEAHYVLPDGVTATLIAPDGTQTAVTGKADIVM